MERLAHDRPSHNRARGGGKVTRWPRMMKRKTAAEYVDMTEAAFESEVAQGRLPAPIMLGGRDHWCQRSLDRALAMLTGEEPLPEWEREFQRRYG